MSKILAQSFISQLSFTTMSFSECMLPIWQEFIFIKMKVCVFGFNVAFNNFSVISRRCLVATGSSLLTFIVLPHWSIMSQTLDMIPHPVTLSWHWVDQSTPYVWVPSEEQLVPFFTTLVCRGPGLNPWPPVPLSGHSTNWAIGAGFHQDEPWYLNILCVRVTCKVHKSSKPGDKWPVTLLEKGADICKRPFLWDFTSVNWLLKKMSKYQT